MPVGSTAHWTRLWQRYLLGTTVLWPLVLEHFYLDAVQPSFSRRAFKKRSTSGHYLCNRYYLKVNRLDVEWRKFSRFFHWNVRLLHSQLGCCVFFKTRICPKLKKIVCNCTEVVGSLLQLYHDTVYFFTTLLPREPPWIAMQIDIFRKSHFGHDYQGLLHYISIFFNATKLWNLPKKSTFEMPTRRDQQEIIFHNCLWIDHSWKWCSPGDPQYTL